MPVWDCSPGLSFCEVIAAVMSVYKPAIGNKDSTISLKFTVFSQKFTEATLPASCYCALKVPYSAYC